MLMKILHFLHLYFSLCAIFCAYVGRDEDKVKVIEAYLKAVRLYRDYSDTSQDPEYSEVMIVPDQLLIT